MQNDREWFLNILEKANVLIGNADDLFEEYSRQCEALAKQLDTSRQIYSNTFTAIQNKIDELRSSGSGLPESDQGDVPEGRTGAPESSDSDGSGSD